MLNLVLGRLIKKHGLLGILVVVGDIAVKMTKTKKDDEAWAKVKGLLNELNA